MLKEFAVDLLRPRTRRTVTYGVAQLPAVALYIALFASFKPARAELVTLLKTPNWDAAIEAQQFIGVIGRTQVGNPMPAKVREFAFYLSAKTRRFGLLIENEALGLPRGAKLPVVISFPGQQAFRFEASMLTGQVSIILDNNDVAAWTHAFTAGSTMTVILPGFGNVQWTYELSGSSPVIGAMATAITDAGITGLPRPWPSGDTTPASASATVAPAPTPGRSTQDDQAMQRRQLEIARIEAEKAKSDAERAQAEANRARAEADRAQAQAAVMMEAKAKAAEEARLEAERTAAEQRRTAAQAKAEIDAHGVQP